MKIKEQFIQNILQGCFPDQYQAIYDKSFLLQYFDKKMKAVHGNCKTRRSLANIYALYALLHFYQKDFYKKPQKYKKFDGFDYMRLFHFYRSLYGGSKLQNHALNSRVNGEFRNQFPDALNDLIIVNNGKYLIHIDYLYVDGFDISQLSCKIIEKYIALLVEKDHALIKILQQMKEEKDYLKKKEQLKQLLSDDAEARIFEIISYAILKNHYKKTKIYWGYSREKIREEALHLYKTGRTNANDGGIDFVMRPVGRFFQVTEVNNYDKYLLDIDKVMHFPVSFVIKTEKAKDKIQLELQDFIAQKAGGMKVVEKRYEHAIEEIITINELKLWINKLGNVDINNIIRDVDIFYKLEMNLDAEDDSECEDNE